MDHTHSLLPNLWWMSAYLRFKCGKVTTGHPWNLQSIVHGCRPFVLMTSSYFGCSLLWWCHSRATTWISPIFFASTLKLFVRMLSMNTYIHFFQWVLSLMNVWLFHCWHLSTNINSTPPQPRHPTCTLHLHLILSLLWVSVILSPHIFTKISCLYALTLRRISKIMYFILSDTYKHLATNGTKFNNQTLLWITNIAHLAEAWRCTGCSNMGFNFDDSKEV